MTPQYIYIDENGNKFYFKDKEITIYHREDGPAMEYADGKKYWYIDNKRHREDGAAVEWCNGDKEWYLNGKRHREDGPAIEFATGRKEWYLNGEYVSKAEHARRTSKTVELTLDDIAKLAGVDVSRLKIVKN